MAPVNADEELFARLEPAAEKSGQHSNGILNMLFADGHTEAWFPEAFTAHDAAARRAVVSVSAPKPTIDY
jgi:prepilin-type processing-associated H-X9-DG protein